MEIILKKDQKWIDFIYENTITDLLQGENFRTDFLDESSTLIIKIDCSCNINEKMQSNNKLDAMDFIDNYSNKLASLRLHDKQIAEYLVQFKKEKEIKNSQLILLFDKEYSYQVKVHAQESGRIIIEVV